MKQEQEEAAKPEAVKCREAVEDLESSTPSTPPPPPVAPGEKTERKKQPKIVPISKKKIETYLHVCNLELLGSTEGERAAATEARERLEAKYPGIAKAARHRVVDREVEDAAKRDDAMREAWVRRAKAEDAQRFWNRRRAPDASSGFGSNTNTGGDDRNYFTTYDKGRAPSTGYGGQGGMGGMGGGGFRRGGPGRGGFGPGYGS